MAPDGAASMTAPPNASRPANSPVPAVASGGTARIAAYGLLALPLAFAALPIYVHVPRLYGEAVGLGLAAIGAILLAARLGDALIDPVIGLWSDRVGKRRLLIGAAIPLLSAGFFALMHPPAGASTTFAMAWLAIALATTTIGFGIVSIAYQAWAAELGADSGERTRLVASREGFTIVGVVLASILPTVAAATLADGLSRLAWVFVPLLILAAIVTLGSCGRRESRAAVLPTPAWRDLLHALDDGAFRRLLVVFVFNGIAAALPSTLVLFFVADVLGTPALSGAFLAVYFVAGVAALPAWLALARRIGRTGAWAVSMGVAVAGFGAVLFLGPGDVLPFFVVCVLSGVALGADLAMPAALLADRAESRSRGEGLMQNGAYMGWWNLVAKLNFALAAGIALPALQFAGYVPGSSTSADPLVLAYGGLPLVFKLLALVLLWRWRKTLENNT
jgi:Na+/melibiose symporter-like transporter